MDLSGFFGAGPRDPGSGRGFLGGGGGTTDISRSGLSTAISCNVGEAFPEKKTLVIMIHLMDPTQSELKHLKEVSNKEAEKLIGSI